MTSLKSLLKLTRNQLKSTKTLFKIQIKNPYTVPSKSSPLKNPKSFRTPPSQTEKKTKTTSLLCKKAE